MSEVKKGLTQVPVFNGEPEAFQAWWIRFHAYGTMHRWARALKEGGESDLPEKEDEDLDPEVASQKKKFYARERNGAAISNLAIALASNSLLNLIIKATTPDWPGGLAHLVITDLFQKYQPKDKMTRVEVREKLNSVSMKPEEAPSVLFEQLSAIQNQVNNTAYEVAEEDLMAVVFNAAPNEYQTLLSVERRTKGDALKLVHLEETMNQHYRQISTARKDDRSEVALVTCYKCGKEGHKANECPATNNRRASSGSNNSNNRNNGQSRPKFKGRCYNCGRVGHRSADCWEKESNKDKRPSRWQPSRSGIETSAAAVDETRVEFLLSSLSFPTSQHLLKDPNVWIADTAATVHSTPHDIGFCNPIAGNKDASITVANGTNASTSKIGDIVGTLCDRHGKRLSSVQLQEVSLLPTGAFNLFSVSKLMMKGWRLSGDSTAMKLTNGRDEIIFDIKIPSPRGMLYAIYIDRAVEMGQVATDKPTLSVSKAHRLLGHPSEDTTRSTAKTLGWTLTKGGMLPCPSCTVAKAKQKNVPKDSPHVPASKDASQIFLDISTVRAPDGTRVPKPNWRILVDERTQLKFSSFFAHKNDMIEPTCAQFQRWQKAGRPVKYLRMDNAGENKKLAERADSSDWKLGKWSSQAGPLPSATILPNWALLFLQPGWP